MTSPASKRTAGPATNPAADTAASGYPTITEDWAHGMAVQSRSLKNQYQTIALIFTTDDLARLVSDDDTLIVCCDWLLAHQLVAQGKHALYYEAGLAAWRQTDNLHTDLNNHTNDWILDGGEAKNTYYRGVCLGTLFGHELYIAMVNYYRIERSLEMLIRTYRPQRIAFYNFQYEFNHLSRKLRSRIISRLADKHKIQFIDTFDLNEGDRVHNDNIDIYRQRDGRSSFKSLLRGIYTFTLQTATRLRRGMMRDSNRVLLLTNTNLLDSLILGYAHRDVTPIMLARSVPRSFTHLWHCFASGIVLVDSKPQTGDDKDELALMEISAALERAVSKLGGLNGHFFADYLRENVLLEPVLRNVMSSVREAEQLLLETKPKRIVVDGVRSQRHATFIELACKHGIAVDYIWHSPLTPQSIKMGALGGDPRHPKHVSRCLSWGDANDVWIERVGKDVPTARVGSPMRRKYESLRTTAPRTAKPVAEKNVLLLQYTYTVLDMAGLNASMYAHFVKSVQILNKLGYRNIRFKLHPGAGRFDVQHFQRIANDFGLECEILKSTPFRDCLEWADLAIGPILSGAVLESLSADVPYYAFLLPPQSTVDRIYYKDFPLLHTIDDLPEALQQDNAEENKKLLDLVWSNNDIPDPCSQFWNVLSDSPVPAASHRDASNNE